MKAITGDISPIEFERALAASDGARRAIWRERLQVGVYGRTPQLGRADVIAKSGVACVFGEARAEIWTLALPETELSKTFTMALVTPAAPRAILIMQAFQRPPGGVARILHALASGRNGQLSARDGVVSAILGEHIHTPPFAPVLQNRIGLAIFCPGDVVPDHPNRAQPILSALTPPCVDRHERGGALAAWAALASAVRIAIAADERFAATPLIACGHSRHGKAALLAGAFDSGFAGVVAHQSGRFGASLTHGYRGESPRQILSSYPHWFCPRLVAMRKRVAFGDIDQHHLLALIAPRPILLGSAAHDLWADPEGAERAARAARELAPAADIASFRRPGWHGINAADWAHFIDFVTARFA